MTLIAVFDRLCGKHFSRLEFKDGSFVVAPEPVLVHYHDSNTLAEAWIEASEDGFVLHFNAKDQCGEMRGQTEPLSNIARVI
jgi:hypothetical protein